MCVCILLSFCTETEVNLLQAAGDYYLEVIVSSHAERFLERLYGIHQILLELFVHSLISLNIIDIKVIHLGLDIDGLIEISITYSVDSVYVIGIDL